MSRERLGNGLSWLTIFGLACFLCGPWLLPSNTYYHRLIILLLWVPAFVHFLVLRKQYPPVPSAFVWLYLALSVWYWLVVALTLERQDDLRELKLPFYIAFSLLGVVVCAKHLKERFADFLLLCGVLGGLGAGWSWIDFYWIEGHRYGERVVSMGLWRVVIPAAQACGALVILTAMLGLMGKRKLWELGAVLLALACYGLFLYFNQSRWVWLSLAMAFVGGGIISRHRTVYAMALASIVLLAIVLWLKPTFLLNRGLSYRPELWREGFNLLLSNWEHGLGLNEYWIEADVLKFSSRHPHNMFLDIGIRFGLLGLLLWAGLWLWAGWRAFRARHTGLGSTLVTLWLYSGLVVLTEGTAPWVKPAPIWFVTWLPIALALAIDLRARSGSRHGQSSVISVWRGAASCCP
ncbi:O-antigen ligase family protein [Serpens gallinarum]|jgi:O-antigen ligase|uniref:O-antigen ligase domain-containing protein n=1 Tax=Serpens gallinarum TaxID=2763075 RepID=A0ABR8TS77_9PSED|nr:O-antigen ligase family protein [Serpens gallinarum]MBD7978631.1 O-antigen ligase domain-containing protein [Serpens gallinarum]